MGILIPVDFGIPGRLDTQGFNGGLVDVGRVQKRAHRESHLIASAIEFT